jgi:hypothetical protein
MFIPGMSNFKQVVIYFLVSKLPVTYYPLLSSYVALSKNIGKNNTTRDKFVVKATYIESTDLTLFGSETSRPAFHSPSVASQVSIG